ncbi:hypothetical protein GN956_G25736 [Arapaima gigas]
MTSSKHKAPIHPTVPTPPVPIRVPTAPPPAAVQQSPLVQMPHPQGPDNQGNTRVVYVQITWDIQELIDVASSLPDPNEVGECFWKEVLALDGIYQPSGGEWTQVRREEVTTGKQEVGLEAGVATTAGQRTIGRGIAPIALNGSRENIPIKHNSIRAAGLRESSPTIPNGSRAAGPEGARSHG